MSSVLDSSALVALMEGEPEAPALLRAILAEDRRFVSAFTIFETLVVILRRHGAAAMTDAEAYIATLGVEILPFDAGQLRLAAAAYARFGKGIDPRARLNLGDCVSYALARTFDAPLLFKGRDFAATDLRAAGG